jgi:hypothetical protein
MSFDTLRRALATNMGEPLTPELCVAIEQAALANVDDSIDLRLFRPLVLDDGYTIQCEKFAKVLPELKPLHEQHWLESEGYRHCLQLRPNYQAMTAFECAGQLLQVTVRHEGKLVGAIRMYITRSWHTGDMLANEDSLYLSPAHRSRSTWLAIRLLRYTVDCLQHLRDSRGEATIVIEASSKLANNARALMKRVFGDPVGEVFHRVFHANHS